MCAGVDDTKVGSAVSVDCFEDLEGIKAESAGFGKLCSFNSFLRSGPLLLLSLVMNRIAPVPVSVIPSVTTSSLSTGCSCL